MKLAIGNDHSAVEMKKEIKKYLEDKAVSYTHLAPGESS